MSAKELGCCGAYCKTCQVFAQGACKGCKQGYDTGERDITKAKCAVKVCCVQRGFDSCAYCGEFESCPTVQGFYGKNGYKYGKYRQACEFIREHGVEAFCQYADRWTGAYGKPDHPGSIAEDRIE